MFIGDYAAGGGGGSGWRLASVDDPLGDGAGQRVEQQGQEQHGDEQDQRDDDVLLVASPHQVKETLEGVDEPGEGSVRTAVRGREGGGKGAGERSG